MVSPGPTAMVGISASYGFIVALVRNPPASAGIIHLPMTTTRYDLEHFAGCLLGGAVGDALGVAVEFFPLALIRQQYGADGIRDLPPGGEISDDTQMTLFTAEALLRGNTRARLKGICSFVAVAQHAYLRWLRTQGERTEHPCFDELTGDDGNGWLIGVRELHDRRAPGTTCLNALRTGVAGTMSAPLNNSKGCGGVMRVAPVGLFCTDAREAFEMGCEAAAITHGHPSGYLSAGCLAAMVSTIIGGADLSASIGCGLDILQTKPGHEECLFAIRGAMVLAELGNPSPANIEQLGQGWTGEEALAIAVYCALVAGNDFAKGVRLAVNHSGDSDSTGAIAGNLLGTLLGRSAIPEQWLAGLELREVIAQISADLFTRYRDDEDWRRRYPGY